MLGGKSFYISFALHQGVSLSDQAISTRDSVRYLGIPHCPEANLRAIQRQTGRNCCNMAKERVNLDDGIQVNNGQPPPKKLVHEIVISWTYGLELWGTASKTNLGHIEKFQPRVRGLQWKVRLYF